MSRDPFRLCSLDQAQFPKVIMKYNNENTRCPGANDLKREIASNKGVNGTKFFTLAIILKVSRQTGEHNSSYLT